ncbi:tripartite tricarboxylate transporter permease [Caballeronia sp. dw_19]|uniref:tripartite tricarboxylate transporter permease n=1 Tax=Caballeronia sp. dw_19 TaxID=2719791 RepID=UPI001BD5F196|nr:tripartite tricarboxylate transporter permease [Caballeronia sp. dw_19]
MHESLMGLWYGFSVALQPHNLVWCVFGVLIGNLVGVLPGMGALSTMSMLLPLTYAIAPVPAILMLAGIFYGSAYGGAIGAILLNLPSHPPHAVTCLDGYPLTRMGKGGTALGITMMASFFAASVGIVVMIFLSPLIVKVAFNFGPPEISSIMLLGLLCGSTLSRGSPLKGVAMMVFGLFCGVVGTDVTSGTVRYAFGIEQLSDGVELVALCMGLFGVADFLSKVNQPGAVAHASAVSVSMKDMRPSWAEIKRSFWPMVRGTAVGTAFGAMPGTGPTITSFLAYALEQRVSRHPERFGTGMLEGVAAPEAASHSKTQVDFIPTLSLGVPGDVIMALILGALIIKGIQPGPQLITQHPDIFWGLVASFWIGNVLLVILNVPLIGVWVKLLQIPYRLLFPTALFFIAVGVYSAQNSLFEVGEVAGFGIIGAIFLWLDFPVSPIVLGFVLGPMFEENFRRTMLLSGGDLTVYVQHPISACFVGASALLILIRLTGVVAGPALSQGVVAIVRSLRGG